MIRKAYVRGVTKALSDTGAVKFASEELAIEAADAVADTMSEQPIGDVAPDATAEIASVLVDLSNQLGEAAGTAAQVAEVVAGEGGGAPAPGAMPPMDAGPPMAAEPAAAPAAAPAPKEEPPKEESPEEKKASLVKAAAFLRSKLAEGTGTTITGDKPQQQNTQSQATGVTGEGAMDTKQRPVDFANVGEDGVGTQEASGDGAIGQEGKIPGVGMGNVAAEGTNSATQAVKSATLRNLIKNAMGTTITGDRPDQQNTPSAAAAVTSEGAMEASMRPVDFANMGEAGVGQSAQQAAEIASAVGTETAHPGSMGHVGQQGTNSAIQQTPGEGATGKTAEDAEWINRFKATSAKYASVLPFWLNTDQKVASVQYLMAMSPSEAQSTAKHIEKTATLPEGMTEYVAHKVGVDKTAAQPPAATQNAGIEKNASVRVGGLIETLRNIHA